MDRDGPLQRLKQALQAHRQALGELESTLLEFEESIDGGPRNVLGRGRPRLALDTGSLQELGMGKSWVYRRLRNGEIPSVKLGRSIKVKREDLEEYLEGRRHRPRGRVNILDLCTSPRDLPAIPNCIALIRFCPSPRARNVNSIQIYASVAPYSTTIKIR